MATTFIEGIEIRPGSTPQKTALSCISYIANPIKTRGGELVSSFRCTPKTADFEMMMEQHEFERSTGRKVIQNYSGKKKSYLLMSLRQSFAPGEVTPDTAHEIGCKLAEHFLGSKYQYVVATHVNTHCIHNHIIFNIVGSDMKKFHLTKYTYKQLATVSDKLCKAYGLTIIVPSHTHGKENEKHAGQKVTSFRTVLKNDIDRCIAAAQNYDDFLKQMQAEYYVSDAGKYLKFRHMTNGQQRFIRAYSLGKGYSKQNIQARIERREDEELELTKTLSYSQKLRNAKAAFAVHGYINQNGSDFEAQVDTISTDAQDVQKQIKDAQKELVKIESILKCVNTVQQYRNSPLRNFPLIEVQGAELELYKSAVEILRENNISQSSLKRIESDYAKVSKRIDDLQAQSDTLLENLNKLDEVSTVVERANSGEQILTKKGEKLYDR